MMNYIPSKVNGELTSSFELVHHVPPDTRTWFPLFSIIFFYKKTDEDQDRTSFQLKAMIGIAVGCSTKTNALSVYNPTTKKYYEPDTYKFDPSHLPCNKFPCASTMMRAWSPISIVIATRTSPSCTLPA